jgi:hypothetical protein
MALAANWQLGVYEADGTLKSGKELWCAGCHDGVPAFSQAVIVVATEVIVDNEDLVDFDSVPASPDPDRWRCKYKAGSYNGAVTMCYNSPGTGSAVATWKCRSHLDPKSR